MTLFAWLGTAHLLEGILLDSEETVGQAPADRPIAVRNLNPLLPQGASNPFQEQLVCFLPGRPSLGSGRLECNASGYSNPETAIGRTLGNRVGFNECRGIEPRSLRQIPK